MEYNIFGSSLEKLAGVIENACSIYIEPKKKGST
jgi:hypothetical protein